MIADIIIINKPQIDWNTLRQGVLKATSLQPSSTIAQCPVKLSEVAEFLVFVTYLKLDNFNDDPYNVLMNLPRECMELVSYTFLILCTPYTMNDLREKTRAHYAFCNMGEYYCSLGTGSLATWFDAIVLNLTDTWQKTEGTRVLLNKMMLFFEKEGLGAIFSKYRKKSLPNKQFLLEKPR